LRVVDLGRLGYAEALAVQEDLVEARLRGDVRDTLLLVEHPPVITLGRRGSLADIFLPEAELAARGIAIHRASRGGLVTYHGPGQLVGYPIVHLRQLGLRVPDYVHGLEAAIVSALAHFGISAWTDPEHIGVWTDQGKIAAIGIAQRHGVAYHGFALNVQPELSHFALINPCGIGERGVTSAAALLGRPVSVDEFKTLLTPAILGALKRGVQGRAQRPPGRLAPCDAWGCNR
jgi:lipoyl(octanoyl) transferase